MRRADREKLDEWLRAADDENAKAIVEAMMHRRTWKGRIEAVLTYIAFTPFMLLYSICSTPGIALISFYVAFMCERISSR